MNILVLGATGYVGSAIVSALRSRGHRVTAAARSKTSALKLKERGTDVVAGDIEAPEALTALARRADGVVYAVQVRAPHTTNVEPRALFALLAGLEGSSKPIVFASSSWIYGRTAGMVVDEHAPLNPPVVIATRLTLERLMLDSAKRHVRSVIIRPGFMYGKGSGLPAMFAQSARENGAATYVGNGRNFWPVAHVCDIAELFALALERARPGDIFNGGDETSFTVKQIAEAASWGAGAKGETASMTLPQAYTMYGSLTDVLTLDQRITSKRARSLLGWTTRVSTILDDLAHGSYTFEERANLQARRA